MRTGVGRRLVVWGLAVVPAAVVWTPSPALAHGGIPETCPEILEGKPNGNLSKETDPPDGSTVVAGDRVKVVLRWLPDDFAGRELHKALDCVTLDGRLSESLSGLERHTPNDGAFEHSFVVPDGLPGGTRVCDRGFVSGSEPDERFERKKSNDVCFTIAAPSPTEDTPGGPAGSPGGDTGSGPNAGSADAGSPGSGSAEGATSGGPGSAGVPGSSVGSGGPGVSGGTGTGPGAPQGGVAASPGPSSAAPSGAGTGAPNGVASPSPSSGQPSDSPGLAPVTSPGGEAPRSSAPAPARPVGTPAVARSAPAGPARRLATPAPAPAAAPAAKPTAPVSVPTGSGPEEAAAAKPTTPSRRVARADRPPAPRVSSRGKSSEAAAPQRESGRGGGGFLALTGAGLMLFVLGCVFAIAGALLSRAKRSPTA